jgi:hypothetical protein
MTFDLSAYDGQMVYVAIQCVSEDRFVFMLDNISIDFTVGTSEPTEEEVEFTLYPNPARDQINITTDNEIIRVDIFNQLGQVVYTQTVKNNYFNLNTSQYTDGIYFVRITTDEGVATKKVLIR